MTGPSAACRLDAAVAAVAVVAVCGGGGDGSGCGPPGSGWWNCPSRSRLGGAGVDAAAAAAGVVAVVGCRRPGGGDVAAVSAAAAAPCVGWRGRRKRRTKSHLERERKIII